MCDEDVAINEAIGNHGAEIIRQVAGAKAGQGSEHPDPLQCRLARHRRLGHGNGADLRGPRTASPCTSGWTRPGRATRAPG